MKTVGIRNPVLLSLCICAGVCAQAETPVEKSSGNSSFSISGNFTWSDGFSTRLVVYNKGAEGSSLTRSGFDGFVLDVHGEKAEVKWDQVKKIQVNGKRLTGQLKVEVTTLADTVITGGVDRIETAGYWHGVKVLARDWVSASQFDRSSCVAEPSQGWSSWSGAGRCRGKSPDWGVWRFRTRKGETITGQMTGAYGIARNNVAARTRDDIRVPVGLDPTDVLGGTCQDGKIRFGLSPSHNVTSLDFTNLPNVRCRLVDGSFENMTIDQQTTLDIPRAGFLIWSLLGKYQVRCLICIKDIEWMEMVKAPDVAPGEKGVDPVASIKNFWMIETAGKQINAVAVRGHQRQLVPTAPPRGKYWFVRPPLEHGETGGEYVVCPNSAGYFIVPLQLVSELLPDKQTVRFRADAGGGEFKFSRFHPGTTWISNGISGQDYIDEDADSTVEIADMWLTYEAYGETSRVELNKVGILKQTDANPDL